MAPPAAAQMLARPVRGALLDQFFPAARSIGRCRCLISSSSGLGPKRAPRTSLHSSRFFGSLPTPTGSSVGRPRWQPCSVQHLQLRSYSISSPPPPPPPSPRPSPHDSTSGDVAKPHSEPGGKPLADQLAEADPLTRRDHSLHEGGREGEAHLSRSETGVGPGGSSSPPSSLPETFGRVMDNLQSRALVASQALNDLTGYSAIEDIKRQNAELEAEAGAAHRRLRAARRGYKDSTAERASTQREVTTLLARKDTWSPADLERFTALYRRDHELEAAVQAAAAELAEAEAEDARLATALNSGILRRYHEEQVWSDRIRRASTWGTWGLMGVNVLLFLVLQFVAEPWRRKRMVRAIAEGDKRYLDDLKRELVGEVGAVLRGRGALLADEEEGVQGGGGGAEIRAETAAAAAAATAATTAAAVAAQPLDRNGEPEPLLPPATAEPSFPDQGATADTTACAPPILQEAKPPHETTAAAAATALAPKAVLVAADLRRRLLRLWWVISDLGRLQAAVADLYSERRIDLRMRDASLLALEGAITGATLAAGLTLMLLRRA